MAGREKAGPAKATEPEVKTVEYMPPGVAPDVTREPFTIDSELEAIRDEEAEANDAVDISGSREEPSIDPELVKARDEQIKREGGKVSASSSDAVPVADSAAGDEPVKKTAAKKSSK